MSNTQAQIEADENTHKNLKVHAKAAYPLSDKRAIVQARKILNCAARYNQPMPTCGPNGLYDYMDAREPNCEQAEEWGLELHKVSSLGGSIKFRKWCQDNATEIGYKIGSENGEHFEPIIISNHQ